MLPSGDHLLEACHRFQQLVREQNSLGLGERISISDGVGTPLGSRFKDIEAEIASCEEDIGHAAVAHLKDHFEGILRATYVTIADADQLAYLANFVAARRTLHSSSGGRNLSVPVTVSVDVASELEASAHHPVVATATVVTPSSPRSSGAGSRSWSARRFIRKFTDIFVFVYLVLAILSMVIEVYALTDSSSLKASGIHPYQHIAPLLTLVIGTVLVALRFIGDVSRGSALVGDRGDDTKRTRTVTPAVAVHPAGDGASGADRGGKAVPSNEECSNDPDGFAALDLIRTHSGNGSSDSNRMRLSAIVGRNPLSTHYRRNFSGVASSQNSMQTSNITAIGSISRGTTLATAYIPLQRIGGRIADILSTASDHVGSGVNEAMGAGGSAQRSLVQFHRDSSTGASASFDSQARSVNGENFASGSHRSMVHGAGAQRVDGHIRMRIQESLSVASHGVVRAKPQFGLHPAALFRHFVIIGLDSSRHIVLWSDGAAAATGLAASDVIGTTVDLLFTDPSVQGHALSEAINDVARQAKAPVASDSRTSHPLRLPLISTIAGSIVVNCVVAPLQVVPTDANGNSGNSDTESHLMSIYDGCHVIIGSEESIVEASGNVFITKYRQGELRDLVGQLQPCCATPPPTDPEQLEAMKRRCYEMVDRLKRLHAVSTWEHVDVVASGLSHWQPYAPMQLLSRAAQQHIGDVEVVLATDVPRIIPVERRTLDALLIQVLAHATPASEDAPQCTKCKMSIGVSELAKVRGIRQVQITFENIDAAAVEASLKRPENATLIDSLVGTFSVTEPRTCRLAFPLVDRVPCTTDAVADEASGGAEHAVASAAARNAKVLTVLVYEPSAVYRQHTIRALWRLGHAAIAAAQPDHVAAVVRSALGCPDIQCALVAWEHEGDQRAAEVVRILEEVPNIRVIHTGSAPQPQQQSQQHSQKSQQSQQQQELRRRNQQLARLVTAVDLVKPLAFVVAKLTSRQREQQALEERRKLFTRYNSAPWQRGRRLGRGAFADVYEAHTMLTGAVTAVKMIWVRDWDAARVQQLMTEIGVLSQLQHPGIVHYFYCERGEETVNLFMELCDGTLREHIARNWGQTMPTEAAAGCLGMILEAVAYVHSKGIVHGDLKSRNVLSRNGRPKLADFGTARTIGGGGGAVGGGGVSGAEETSVFGIDSSRTSIFAASSSNDAAAAGVTVHAVGAQAGVHKAATFRGTLRNMAPEQSVGKATTFAVDIWCIGLLAVEMLAGEDALPPMAWCSYDLLRTSIQQLPLTGDARDFVEACLQFEAMRRPSAQTLLAHPFISDVGGTTGAMLTIYPQEDAEAHSA